MRHLTSEEFRCCGGTAVDDHVGRNVTKPARHVVPDWTGSVTLVVTWIFPHFQPPLCCAIHSALCTLLAPLGIKDNHASRQSYRAMCPLGRDHVSGR